MGAIQKEDGRKMQERDEIAIEITAMAHDGRGIGRHDGVVVFVPGAILGDAVLCRVVKRDKRSLSGELLRVLEPSPCRQTAPCPYFADCGGCTYQNMTYPGELAVKQERVASALTRLGGVDPERILPILGAPETGRYRNNAQFAVGGTAKAPVLGCYARESRRVVPVADCLLQMPEAPKVLAAFARYLQRSGAAPYDPETGRGLVRHLCLRSADSGLMATVVAAKASLPREAELAEALQAAGVDTASIHVNAGRGPRVLGLGETRSLFGPGYLTDILCGLRFRISPTSFYQVNHAQAQLLYETAKSMAEPGPDDTVLDLYCGTGTIGLTMAKDARRLIGVESVASAIRDARDNAVRNGIVNAEFHKGDAGTLAQALLKEGLRPQIIVLDPPRRGCDAATLSAVTRLSPRRVVYVSCDPATLARDVKILSQAGFALKKAQPIDLFPRTPHVECVVLMCASS
jgi:23S rRNA (uracil1939-C5)-methyltransferase